MDVIFLNNNSSNSIILRMAIIQQANMFYFLVPFARRIGPIMDCCWRKKQQAILRMKPMSKAECRRQELRNLVRPQGAFITIAPPTEEGCYFITVSGNLASGSILIKQCERLAVNGKIEKKHYYYIIVTMFMAHETG